MHAARLILAVAVALFIGVADARADWQFTKWGMNPDQVAKAGGGKVSNLSAEELKEKNRFSGPSPYLMSMPYKAGAFDFTAYFRFTSGKLSRVTLELANPMQVPDLRTSLIGLYGQPYADEGGGFSRASWADRKLNNNITLTVTTGAILGEAADLTYTLLDKSAGGL